MCIRDRSNDAGAADDEDNKNQNYAENAENNEQAAASDSNAQNNTENLSLIHIFAPTNVISIHKAPLEGNCRIATEGWLLYNLLF